MNYNRIAKMENVKLLLQVEKSSCGFAGAVGCIVCDTIRPCHRDGWQGTTSTSSQVK
jgi:hypothetical protein